MSLKKRNLHNSPLQLVDATKTYGVVNFRRKCEGVLGQWLVLCDLSIQKKICYDIKTTSKIKF